MFSPSDVKFTNSQIMLLAATITGGDPAKRAADKPSAITNFTKALTQRIGEEKAMEVRSSVLMADSFLEAHTLVGEIIDKVKEGTFTTIEDFLDCGQQDAVAVEELILEEDDSDAVGGETADAVINTREEANMTDKTEAETNRRGRKSQFAGKVLNSKCEANPRRANTHGFKSHQIILDNPGISTERFVELGGRANDLKWDIDNDFASAE